MMLLYNKNTQTNNDNVFVLNTTTNIWEETNPEDKLYIQNAITDWRIEQSTLNNIVGYIGYENKNLGEKIKILTPWMESKLKCLGCESLLFDIKSII